MHESAICFHHIEWPPPEGRVAGPVLWLKGWLVGKADYAFVDVRVRHDTRIHLGVLGFPRADLAQHFQSSRTWLPGGFAVGVPVADGPIHLYVEAMDEHGNWHPLSALDLTVVPDGQPGPHSEGQIVEMPGGSWTCRGAHTPFRGHLDEPAGMAVIPAGRMACSGWLLHDTQAIHRVRATTDTILYNRLEANLEDTTLATKLPDQPGAGQARLMGEVDVPSTLASPACLRVYAETTDGSTHLCFARRLTLELPAPAAPEPAVTPPAYPPPRRLTLADFPCGRPRRLLMSVRSLQPCDATLRALDLAQHLIAGHRWAVRLVGAEDGPLRTDFHAIGVETLIVDPQAVFTAPTGPALENALARLGRQIWWKHLDAVAVFDPLCFWAQILATRQGLPTLFDCSHTSRIQPDTSSAPVVAAAMHAAWKSSAQLCFSSHLAASAQAELLRPYPAEVIPFWYSPGLSNAPAPAESQQLILAPLRSVDWLARHHPDIVAGRRFVLPALAMGRRQRLAQDDASYHHPGLIQSAPHKTEHLTLYLNTPGESDLLRPLLDAVACGVPIVTTRTPLIAEFIPPGDAGFVAPGNPLACAHAVLAHAADAGPFLRRAAAAQEHARAVLAPDGAMTRWQQLLESTVAAARVDLPPHPLLA